MNSKPLIPFEDYEYYLNMVPGFGYMNGDRAIPHHAPQRISAVPFYHVGDDEAIHQEGLIFDRAGDMYFTDIYKSLVKKIDMKTGEISVALDFPDKNFQIGAVKFHKDGRMFLAGCDFPNEGKSGGVYCCNPDGSDLKCITSGYNADDLVFDQEGGMYVTNFSGMRMDKKGFVEYIASDMKTKSIFIDNLEGANGICFSPDYSVLWVTETNAGNVIRVDMKSPNKRLTTTPFHTEGFFGPDSCCCDADGNVYIAMSRQGRVIVLNPLGFKIGEITTPGCEQGINLGTTHPQIRPGTNELFITVHDVTGVCGANIFFCKAFAGANMKQYHLC